MQAMTIQVTSDDDASDDGTSNDNTSDNDASDDDTNVVDGSYKCWRRHIPALTMAFTSAEDDSSAE